jgi:hypothetical protein
MMDAKAAVDGVLAELGARMGAASLALSKAGTCAFDYKDGMRVVIELPAGSSVLQIYAPIMAIPPRGREQLFRKLLGLNLFGHATRGASFAISEDHGMVILCYGHAVAGLDAVLFETILANFLMTLDHWHAELNSRDESSEKPATRRGFESQSYLKA